MVPSISGMSAPHVVSGASGYSSPAVKMGNLFQQIDTGNTGSISKSQFQQAFSTMNPPGRFQSMGASAVFSKLDPNRTGSVSKSNFVSGMTSLMKSMGASSPSSVTAVTPPTAPATSASGSQSLSDSLQSFMQMGGQPLATSGGVGSIINTQA